MATPLEAPPVLSTPDTHIFEASENPAPPSASRKLSDDELRITYDIDRTIKEIKQGRWQRIALQFPDEMLPDAPQVFQLLSRGLTSKERAAPVNKEELATDFTGDGPSKEKVDEVTEAVANAHIDDPRLYILADTSYGTCCVDEVAAEHVDADVVVHYGRACLSPTARLPVIYVFTHRQLDVDRVVAAFKETYPNREEKVVVVADVTFADHVETITSKLEREGYTNLFATSLLHDPSSPIPNRTVPDSVREKPESLQEWQLFHISDPPTALLLTLSSRVAAIHIYPTDQESESEPPSTTSPKPLLASTAMALRRRYAILTRLSTVPIFGILINTLSVKNYLHIVEHVKAQIAAAGKKSYMFVVGKLNAAKVANFSEIGGWVVIGCWESSLVDSKDFWKPVITPYELELALKRDEDRVWTGEWRSDYQTILDSEKARESGEKQGTSGDEAGIDDTATDVANGEDDGGEISEEESAPPEFDLRTGRYISVSSTRPMQTSSPSVATSTNRTRSSQPVGSSALTKRTNGELATIGGVVSPGAEFLRSQRTWQGLGSDFDIRYEEDGDEGTAVAEGRSGIARGYTVGESAERH
ncbi:Diphthamide biosynthesis protein 2 [Onygenales sp. PD_40]|nr:Diphthamide biosynthesis protein 2 [Onygenales sp. PD_40]KAK2780013.1 Diphthamide biosynthesis protein 2 [Emmonsiellopsis sp. PD_33]KAK2783395.1 Diphthamide biosynthesis protein 2 [Onygenales sp. PD_12]KAK2792328.1 Diphthamide biosynthesis protein 2 [Onygenales sp. PD_10]